MTGHSSSSPTRTRSWTMLPPRTITRRQLAWRTYPRPICARATTPASTCSTTTSQRAPVLCAAWASSGARPSTVAWNAPAAGRSTSGSTLCRASTCGTRRCVEKRGWVNRADTSEKKWRKGKKEVCVKLENVCAYWIYLTKEWCSCQIERLLSLVWWYCLDYSYHFCVSKNICWMLVSPTSINDI